MKLKKKSGLMGAVIALSAASLVSVGFASWVISQGDEAVANGTILVDNVVENDYTIVKGTGLTGTGTPYTVDQKICFGWAAFDDENGANTNYGWLRNDDKLNGVENDSSEQVLTASFEFTINNITGAKCAAGPAASLTFSDGSGYQVSAALTATGYTTTLGGKANVLAGLPTPSLSYNSSTSVFTCSVTFGWGTGLDGQNPMTYYNKKQQTAALAQEAYDVLHALEGMEATYTITLTVAKAA